MASVLALRGSEATCQRDEPAMIWATANLKAIALSPSKAVANNVGHGIDADGQVVYETASVYLVYRSDASWVIQTLNPYLLENHFVMP